MVLSRLDFIEEFIDKLVDVYETTIFDRLSQEGLSAEEIYESDEWKYRGYYITHDDSCSCCGNEDIDWVISEFEHEAEYNECYEIRHGVQQIVFIFDDIVYKISSYDIGRQMYDLKCNLDDKFQDIFPAYCYIKTYKECNIFTQEKVEPNNTDNYYYQELAKANNIEYEINDWTIRSDNCCAAIALKYGTEFLEELCKELSEAGYNYDIHNENFGVTESGDIRIFDPIYDEEY